jgi:hypothetical protein
MAGKKTQKKLSPWNLFVMEVKKQNPEKSFKEVLVLASKLKKQGIKYGDYVKNKSFKAVKKITNTLNITKGNKKRKNKTNKKRGKGKK